MWDRYVFGVCWMGRSGMVIGKVTGVWDGKVTGVWDG